LPPDTFQTQYQETCKKIFQEIEDKKNQVIRLQQSNYTRKMDELETKRMVEQYRILTEDEW
jgi:DnaJ family protein C protein 8